MARMMIRHPYSGRPVASSDAAAIAISAMRRPGPSNVTMVLAVLTVLLGYFFFYFIGEPIVFYGGCAFLTGVCGYHALSSLFFGELNIGAVISSQTMLWHALPFSYIVLFGYENYIHEISELYNAESLVIVVIISLITYFYFNKFGKSISIQGILIKWRDYVPVILPILMMQIYLIASGSRGYASVVGIGSEIGGEREATLLYQFTTGLSPALMPMCAVALAAIFRGRPAQRNIISVSFFLFVLAVQFLWWTTAGRRSMTIIALISAVSFFAIYYRSQLNGRRVFIIAALVLAAIPILWFLWEGYYLLRIATDVSRGAENLSILNLGRARELSVNSNVEGQFVENIIRRPFLILTSLSIVREATNGVLWGWNIISQALLTIPSVLFPNKFEFIGPVLENLWYFELGVPLNDWTNTMFVEGYIDFYIFGFPIYVYIIYILFILIIKISIYSGYTAIVFFSYFNLSFSILSVETTTNALFVCIRSTLFVIFVALFVRFLQRGRWMGRQFS